MVGVDVVEVDVVGLDVEGFYVYKRRNYEFIKVKCMFVWLCVSN